MGVYQADAIVIRSREYKESDRLLTLFSREYGKIQAVAKGVRKPKSKQRAGSQLFTYADYFLYKGKSLDTVNQASPKESFPHLWTDFDLTMAATVMVEILDISTPVGHPYPELFTLTYSCLTALEHCDPSLIQCAYTLKLLTYLGYQPRFNECAECGEKVLGERLWFSPKAGGVVCSKCKQESPFIGRYVRAGSIALMRQLLIGDLNILNRIRLNNWMKKEILDTIQLYSEQTLDRHLRSWSMGSRLVDVGQKPNGKDEDS